MDRDLIDAGEVAHLLGVKATSSARAQLSRWGIKRAGLSDDPRPKALYDRAEVEQAIANRSGRGRRTDLIREEDQ
jgi:hypothetical protein